MKAYLSKGYGMDAGLVFTPKAVEAVEDPQGLPESIRGWSIRIVGKDNEEIVLNGKLQELEQVVIGIRGAWIEIAKTEEARTDARMEALKATPWMQEGKE